MDPELVQRVTAMTWEANKPDFMDALIYRRNATVYLLSSTVNHIVGCWVSEHFKPIPVLVSRGRVQLREFLPGAPNAADYYAFVPQYFDAMEAALLSGGLWGGYWCDN